MFFGATLSHNQNRVLKWSTQKHVKKSEGGDPQLFLVGIVPYYLHLPESVLIVAQVTCAPKASKEATFGERQPKTHWWLVNTMVVTLNHLRWPPKAGGGGELLWYPNDISLHPLPGSLDEQPNKGWKRGSNLGVQAETETSGFLFNCFTLLSCSNHKVSPNDMPSLAGLS